MSSKNKACDTGIWDKNRNTIRSRNGGWVMGKGIFCHGYDMMEDLVGHKSYLQVMILNATGRMVPRALADWIDAIHICLSWPDPRIWCNQIGALGGSARCSVIAATAAGIVAADSKIYGSKTLIGGLRFIQDANRQLKDGNTVESIVRDECNKHGGKPYVMGYARPIAKGDERIIAMERVTQQLGFEVGEHLSLAYSIEEILMRDFDEGMNINGYMSAFLSDQGFTAEEVYRIFTIFVSSGVTACYVDTAGKPEDTFLPLTCDDIVYEGKGHRPVPRNNE